MTVATIQYLVNAIDNMSGPLKKMSGNAAALAEQLNELNDTFKSKLELEGGAQVQAQLGDIGVKLARLNQRVTTNHMNSDQITRAMIQTAALNLELDKATRERTVHVNTGALDRVLMKGPDVGGRLSGIIGRLPSGGAGGGGLLGRIAGIPGIGGGLSGLLGTGAGAGGGLAGTGVGALGASGGGIAALVAIGATLAALPAIATAAGGAIIGALGGALTYLGVNAANKLPLVAASFAKLKFQASQDLTAIAGPFGRALQTIYAAAKAQLPTLFLAIGDAFRTIAPQFSKVGVAFVSQLGGPAVTNAIRSLGTAFALFLKAFAPQIPGIVTSLANGIRGLASAFIDHPQMIRIMADILGWLLKLPGVILAVIGALVRFVAMQVSMFTAALNDAKRFWDLFTRGFDIVRHAVATIWDLMWRNTVGRVQSGIADVKRYINGLPGWLQGVFKNAGRWLLAAGKAIMGGLLKGLLAGFGPVGGFIASLPGKLAGLLGGGGSGGSGMGHGSAGSIGMSAGGAVGLGRSMAAARGWSGSQWTALFNLWQRESGWNPNAVNPSSGAYGIPQALGHGHPFNLGDASAQIAWGLNYIAGRYGSPGAAWAHETQFGWYDRGGWLMPGVSMAVNTSGAPEAVIPGTGSGSVAEMVSLLRQLVAATHAAPARTGAAVTGGITGGVRAAGRAGYFSPRPR